MPDPTPSLGSDVPAHRAVLARLRTALGRLADATNAADVAREQAARVPANPAEWGEVYATAEQAVRDAERPRRAGVPPTSVRPDPAGGRGAARRGVRGRPATTAAPPGV